MKQYLTIIFLCIVTVTVKAQTAAADTTIFIKVEKNASFPGGM